MNPRDGKTSSRILPRYENVFDSIWRILAIASVVALAVTAGCGGASRQTPLMTESQDVTTSARELRARGNEFAKRFAGVVEAAADSISAQTEDPRTARNTLIWKLGAISALEQGIFQPDPLGSFVDAWALTLQMRAYFETGVGKDLFGEWQPVAVRASRRLETDITVLARGLAPSNEVSQIEERVSTWAREHPLTSPSFLRENPVPLYKQISQLSGGLSAVTSMEETMEDLTTRLNVYAVLLPKQARWQSELLLGEYVEPQEMTRLLENMDRITVAAVEIAEFTDTAVLDSMRSERVAVVNAINEQRVATLDELSSQLAEVLRFVHAERLGMMAQMDSLTVAAMELASPRLEDVIDHFFWRATQLLAGLVVVCAVGGLVVSGARGKRRRSHAVDETS